MLTLRIKQFLFELLKLSFGEKEMFKDYRIFETKNHRTKLDEPNHRLRTSWWCSENLPAITEDPGAWSLVRGRSHITWSNWAHVPKWLSLRPRACESQLWNLSATTNYWSSARRVALTLKSQHTPVKSSPVLTATRESPGSNGPAQPKLNKENLKNHRLMLKPIPCYIRSSVIIHWAPTKSLTVCSGF